MRNIIEKLYEGDIRPIEEYWSIQEMDENHRLRIAECDQFTKDLNEIDADLMRRFTACMGHQAERLSAGTAGAFSYGFRLGVKMMLEILYDEKEK